MTVEKIDYASTHRKVVAAIHDNWINGEPFALRDAALAADVSVSSVVRVLKLLKKLKLVKHSVRAYAGRHYSVAPFWPSDKQKAIETFEYAKILKL